MATNNIFKDYKVSKIKLLKTNFKNLNNEH